mgnify:CR=1 FL=1
MKNTIKNWFTGGNVNQITIRSLNALNTFTRVINDLTEVNSEIETTVKFKNEEIEILQHETKVLEEQEAINTKIIEKINNLLD